MSESNFDQWAVLELMGHRKLAGRVRDVQHFGVRMCRIDIPSEPPVTQYYGGSAIFGVHPTTEEVCTAFARRSAPTDPVHAWELRPESRLPQEGWRGATADELEDDQEPEDAEFEEADDDRPFG